MSDKPFYTAHAHVVGGRENGHGVSSDGALDVQLRLPGQGGGTNPEQLFAVGYAACFEGAIAAVAQRERLQPGAVEIDSVVEIWANPDRTFRLEVALNVTIEGLDDPSTAVHLVETAHSVCPYSNAIRGNVPVRLSVNGTSLG